MDPLPSGTVDFRGQHVFASSPPPNAPRVSGYECVRRLGGGGMGDVWLSRQIVPVQRLVAIKCIKRGIVSESTRLRFSLERQSMALLDHLSLAKVWDGGITEEGLPYLVMEYIEGVPLTEYCNNSGANLLERLGLFIQICRATHHAHQKSVIHRDLKPENILVTQYEGKPIPKVIDFGLAKTFAAGESSIEHQATEVGTVLGTFQYMSPEQASLNDIDIDTRSDVYSLGVILYELLTGEPPLSIGAIKSNSVLEILSKIRSNVPKRPSVKVAQQERTITEGASLHSRKWQSALRNDLDWIVMKAIEVDRERRYESAAAFADDIERYLADQPVLARPPSSSYRIKKFVTKNKFSVVALGTVVMSLLVGAIGTGVGYRRALLSEAAANVSRDQALQAEEKASKSLANAQASLSILQSAFRSFDPDRASSKKTVEEVFTDVIDKLPQQELAQEARAKLQFYIAETSTSLGLGKLAISVLSQINSDLLEPNEKRRLVYLRAISWTDAGDYVAARAEVQRILNESPLFQELNATEIRKIELAKLEADNLESTLRSDKMDLFSKEIEKLYGERVEIYRPLNWENIMVISMVRMSKANATPENDISTWRRIIQKTESEYGKGCREAISLTMQMAPLFADVGRVDEGVEELEKAEAKLIDRYGKKHHFLPLLKRIKCQIAYLSTFTQAPREPSTDPYPAYKVKVGGSTMGQEAKEIVALHLDCFGIHSPRTKMAGLNALIWGIRLTDLPSEYQRSIAEDDLRKRSEGITPQKITSLLEDENWKWQTSMQLLTEERIKESLKNQAMMNREGVKQPPKDRNK